MQHLTADRANHITSCLLNRFLYWAWCLFNSSFFYIFIYCFHQSGRFRPVFNNVQHFCSVIKLCKITSVWKFESFNKTLILQIVLKITKSSAVIMSVIKHPLHIISKCLEVFIPRYLMSKSRWFWRRNLKTKRSCST